MKSRNYFNLCNIVWNSEFMNIMIMLVKVTFVCQAFWSVTFNKITIPLINLIKQFCRITQFVAVMLLGILKIDW